MFRNPFSFEGRIGKFEYSISFAVYIIAYAAVMGTIRFGGRIGAMVGIFCLAALIWFILAQGAKRCHDIGKSGWWQLIPFFVFWLLFEEGDTNANKYDVRPDPENMYTRDQRVTKRDPNGPDGPPMR